MTFKLVLVDEAPVVLKLLKYTPHLSSQFKAVSKALIYLQNNPRHPSLQTHKYHGMAGPEGQDVFEAYAQQNTPGAYRIFFYYGPGKCEITVFAIVAHP